MIAAALAQLALGQKISQEISTGNATAKVDVIIQYVIKPGLTDQSKVTAKGGTIKRKFVNIPAMTANLSIQAARDLSADSNVRYVSIERKVRGSLEFANPTVNATLAYNGGFRGNAVGIAIIDSGINTGHADLKSGTTSRVVYSENFVPGETTTADTFGHGTHVAGIAGGNAALSAGTVKFRGMAPDVKFINLRVLDGQGSGFDSSTIAAIDKAISLKTTYNIRVINLSLGRPIMDSYATDPLCDAVGRAWKAGIVVVVAAGNRGRDDGGGREAMAPLVRPAIIRM